MNILTAEQYAAIQRDLETLGVEGSSLLAIPPFAQSQDFHQYVREIMLAFYRAVFRTLPDTSLRWDPDPAVSKIQIRYADPRDTVAKGITPALTAELGPFTWGNHAINNLLHEYNDGTRLYSDLRNGSVILRARSSTKLEAESMASMASAALHQMHSEIERITSITLIDANTTNPASGELVAQNPSGEFFVATVVCNVHHQETWRTLPRRRIVGKVQYAEPKGTPFP